MANPPSNAWWTQSQPNLPSPMPPTTTLASGSTMANPYKWPLQAIPGTAVGGPQTPPMGAVPLLNITRGPVLPNGTHAVAYTSVTFTAMGGTSPYTWSATGLPAGMTFTAGVLAGTPTTAGTTTFPVTCTDAATPAHTTTENFTITIV